ncbi:hypothetical protein ZOSMA_198G00230 [Zostera marina]|uniref:EXS domain-containing protein n=1 Tax=Zostera marina TaxID=29655 RepID=A0A0K9PNT5_ZOSMR|nr:hypothetical protein ZOSMA_198G00230 [Zostera marina]
MDPFVLRCFSKAFTRIQWLVYDARLPNIKICTLFLICLFVYDVFWVFFSERFFGENVMWIRKLILFFQKTYFYFSRKLIPLIL